MDARAKAEDEERKRWLAEARKLLIHARLPISVLAAGAAQPALVWSGVGQALRARTSRRRVKDWQKAARFFTLTSGASWPQDVGSLLHYMQVLVDGDVAPSGLQSMILACSFMEKAGGVEKGAQLAVHPARRTRGAIQ